RRDKQSAALRVELPRPAVRLGLLHLPHLRQPLVTSRNRPAPDESPAPVSVLRLIGSNSTAANNEGERAPFIPDVRKAQRRKSVSRNCGSRPISLWMKVKGGPSQPAHSP